MGLPIVTEGALMMCSFGVAPSSLIVTSNATVTVGGIPAATLMDYAPFANIPCFGVCLSPMHPGFVGGVVSAALGGAPVAPPCTPAVATPWLQPALITTIDGLAVLLPSAVNHCALSGVIKFVTTGQSETDATSL